MQEFLAILATFVFGLGVTSVLGYSLEYQQRVSRYVDENADVRAGIITVTASGFALGKATPSQPVELGFRDGSATKDM